MHLLEWHWERALGLTLIKDQWATNYTLKGKWYKVIHLKILFRSSITPHKLKKVNCNVSDLCWYCCGMMGTPIHQVLKDQCCLPVYHLKSVSPHCQTDQPGDHDTSDCCETKASQCQPWSWCLCRHIICATASALWIRYWDGADSSGKFWANCGTQSRHSSVVVSQALNVIVQLCPIAGLLGNSVDGLASKELKHFLSLAFPSAKHTIIINFKVTTLNFFYIDRWLNDYLDLTSVLQDLVNSNIDCFILILTLMLITIALLYTGYWN